MDEETRAAVVEALGGRTLTDIESCSGNDDHEPHITLHFGDFALSISPTDTGVMFEILRFFKASEVHHSGELH